MQFLWLLDQAVNRFLKCPGVVWIDKNRSAFPVFAQARDIGEDERTAGQRRFENGQAEGLVARSRREDGRLRHPMAQFIGKQITEIAHSSVRLVARRAELFFTSEVNRPGKLIGDVGE